MNTKIITISLVVLVLAFAGYFAYSRMQSSNVVMQDDKMSESSMREDSSMMGDVMEEGKSLFELLSQNETVQCTYSSGDDFISEGTVYVAGKKARAMMKGNSTGIEVESNIIADDNDIYIWGNGYGIKVSRAEAENVSNEFKDVDLPDAQSSQVDTLNKKVKTDCQPWVEDPSMFIVPEDVEFNDVDAMLEGLRQIGESSMEDADEAFSNACEACESLGGDLRVECLQNLGCN